MRLHASAHLTAHWCRTRDEWLSHGIKNIGPFMNTAPTQTGLTPTSTIWLFLGLVGPLIPGGVLALMALLRRASPTYGPLLALTISAVVLVFLLLRPSVTENHRKSFKLGLDAAWNLWAFIGVGLLFVSAGTINGDTLKLETQLKSVGPTLLSLIFITVCSTAAARISMAVAEWVVSRRPKPGAAGA